MLFILLFLVLLLQLLFFFEQAKMKYITTKRRLYLAQGVPERTAVLQITSTHDKKELSQCPNRQTGSTTTSEN
jgi:hypothetical protein